MPVVWSKLRGRGITCLLHCAFVCYRLATYLCTHRLEKKGKDDAGPHRRIGKGGLSGEGLSMQVSELDYCRGWASEDGGPQVREAGGKVYARTLRCRRWLVDGWDD